MIVIRSNLSVKISLHNQKERNNKNLKNIKQF